MFLLFFCLKISIFAPMKRKILTYGGYFEAFMDTLKEKEQEKVMMVR